MLGVVKFTETDHRLVVAWGWGRGERGRGSDCIMGEEFCLGVTKMFCNSIGW